MLKIFKSALSFTIENLNFCSYFFLNILKLLKMVKNYVKVKYFSDNIQFRNWPQGGGNAIILTLATIWSIKSSITLASSKYALTTPTTSIGTILGQFFRDTKNKWDFLWVHVVIIEGKKPMALFQVIARWTGYSRLQ